MGEMAVNPGAIDALNEQIGSLILVDTTNVGSVSIPVGSAVNVGTINNLITIPTGYLIGALTVYSASAGNCIPFVRNNNGTLELWARNFLSSEVTTNIYVRTIFVKSGS